MRSGGWWRVAAAVAAVVGLVVVVLVVVGVAESRPLVLLAGDSITEWNAGALAGALDGTFGIGGDDVAVVATAGATAGEMEPAVVAEAAAGPRQVVINLGTNDVAKTGDVAQGLAAIERIAAAFPGAACIHLVTLNESMVTFEDPTGPGPRAAELNHGLEDLATRNGYHLIRWDQMVAEANTAGTALTVDSIHPNDEGAARLADAYREAIDGCGG
jgi:lysophospholipase L1-like esterase